MARKMLNDGTEDGELQFDYDLFTIGAGSGGVRASRMSASFGAKVAICELPFHPISSDKLGGCGGTCVIRGCVPKKILVYGSMFHGEFEDSKNFGWNINGDITFDWKRLVENKTKEIVRLNGVYKKILSGAGVTLFEGAGKVIDEHTVEVHLTGGQSKRFTARHILIATGSRAGLLDIPGKELAITSDEALSLDEFPQRSVIVGGGYIAVEFAGIYNGMGSKVDLFYRKETPLRGFDDEMRSAVAKNLEGRGVTLHPNTNIIKIEKVEGGLKAYSDKGDEIETDVVLLAVGRKPHTKGLNLDVVGVELLKDGAIKVNEYSQTSVPSIWAIGDVTNRINLTPVALMEGTFLAKTLFGGQKMKPDYENVPHAVFSIPPLSTVGLSEQEAISQAKNDILVFSSSFTPMKNTISGRQEKTLMKLIVDADTDKVLGVSMCGPDSPEILQGMAVALKCNATKAQLDSTVGIHPSAAEEFVTMRTATRRVSPDGQVKKT
ncbi:hypothetical protein L7F22_016065 [Adiantum nelumboides]|nr:hypothetical protein [Adiantum nelumboides]